MKAAAFDTQPIRTGDMNITGKETGDDLAELPLWDRAVHARGHE